MHTQNKETKVGHRHLEKKDAHHGGKAMWDGNGKCKWLKILIWMSESVKQKEEKGFNNCTCYSLYCDSLELFVCRHQ